MIEIKPYEPAFRQRCIEIFESNQPKFFTVAERDLFIGFLDNKTAANYYVLKLDGEVIGCGGIFVNDNENIAGLSWGMVHSAFHRQGYGKLFTAHRVNLLRSLYPDKICRIDTSQHTVSFYEQFGFTTIQVIENGYGEGLHKNIMQSDPLRNL
jgi:predicted GNAT family N-acyltransferase